MREFWSIDGLEEEQKKGLIGETKPGNIGLSNRDANSDSNYLES